MSIKRRKNRFFWPTMALKAPRQYGHAVTLDQLETIDAHPRDAVEEVVALIRRSPGVTRREIARNLGASSSAVTNIVGRLLREGRLEQREGGSGGRGVGSGRPASRLYPAVRGLHTAAIDFGHSHVTVALGNEVGEVVGEPRSVVVDVDADAKHAMAQACVELKALMAAHGVSALSNVVAGIPGPLDRKTGVVQSPTILSGWVGHQPGLELAAMLEVPVHIENDAVLGAYGEYRTGAGRGKTHVLYLKISHGIGAGVIVNGRPMRGAGGFAGEIGHLLVPNATQLCRCGGRGCLESVVSVDQVSAQFAVVDPTTPSAPRTKTNDNSPVTVRVFEEAGHTLGLAISGLCHLLNPDVVVLGGELGSAHPAFAQGVQLSLERYSQPAILDGLSVVTAAWGTQAELRGGLALAAELIPDTFMV